METKIKIGTCVFCGKEVNHFVATRKGNVPVCKEEANKVWRNLNRILVHGVGSEVVRT